MKLQHTLTQFCHQHHPRMTSSLLTVDNSLARGRDLLESCILGLDIESIGSNTGPLAFQAKHFTYCSRCYISFISFPFMYCLIIFRFSSPCLCLCENEREVIVQGCVNCLSTCLLWECSGVFYWLLITNQAPIISSRIAPHLFIFKPRFYLFCTLGRKWTPNG